ncbi:uncharacterized protein LOC110648159 isoform X2 [Hevea brasiliensis]|uniref:uncharacterized protein LOC110648159 isoform X2 n=1 Tax=Hevea brasiliensis TaxID=3981 RepID=UPI0025DF40EF|nr:uncharacterized protein LOC110648159 isoform X2 [Hevea brasiliensis]
MENGHDGKLANKMSGLALNDSATSSSNLNFNNSSTATTTASTTINNSNNNDSLFQVMKAVEAAEATIRQQAEENTRLRTELQKKIKELEKYKIDESIAQRSHSIDQWNERVNGPYEVHQSVPSVGDLEDKVKSMGSTSAVHQSGTLNREDPAMKSQVESHSDSSKINGTLKVLPGGQAPVDNAGLSQLSSPSTTSVSPSRYQMEGEYDQQFNLSGHGQMQMAKVNNPGDLWKEVREHEEEILQLRKHLSDYSMKEAQIRNEKYVMEKRIAYMRLAFDQQQQDLVDTQSKALSYRQDIIEENIRLTYELQAAQQERSTFVSSLLPLLAEYSLQPPVPDAQSIVSDVRVLFRHLQEKLIQTESKLKESQYQMAPWRSDVNHSNVSPQSPSLSTGLALHKNGLELVSQPAYSLGKIPMTSPDAQTSDWDRDLLSHQQRGLGGAVAKNLESDDLGRYSPLASRNSTIHDIPAQFAATRGDSRAVHYGEEITNKQVTFSDPVSNNEMDNPDAEGQQNEREPSASWGTTALDDPGSSYSPYLPPVLEEPSSSFSEEDDPLPAIEGLQISGEAFPGQELQACGYSINGTTSCNFEWVRHLEDGSVDYIDGAKQPNYLVTADDVDTYLAIEVQPLDDRKRKGELVKVFANEHRKIICDLEMQRHIEKTLYSGHASYKVSLSTGYLDIWEPVTLAIKRDGYNIKGSGSSGAIFTEKFSPNTSVAIPYGQPTEFIITSSSGIQHLLRVDSNSMDFSCSRDTIVIILRLFIIRDHTHKLVFFPPLCWWQALQMIRFFMDVALNLWVRPACIEGLTQGSGSHNIIFSLLFVSLESHLAANYCFLCLQVQTL